MVPDQQAAPDRPIVRDSNAVPGDGPASRIDVGGGGMAGGAPQQAISRTNRERWTSATPALEFACRRSPSAPPSPGMYVVTEADAAAIREAYETGGELSAAVELRRRFPGITDNATAREQARRIAAWTPLPDRPLPHQRARKRKASS